MYHRCFCLLLWLVLGALPMSAAEMPRTAQDEMFRQSMPEFWAYMDRYLPEIWPGMTLGPACIYRRGGVAFLTHHPKPPAGFQNLGDGVWQGNQAEWNLYGNTQVQLGDVLTAISFYGNKEVGTTDFHAVLLHELHHVYQRNLGVTLLADDPAVLITYPENAANEGLRALEERTLLRMLESTDASGFQVLLDQFYAIRQQRQTIIGRAYLDYEQRVESLEGPATYCQYRFLELKQQEHPEDPLPALVRQGEFLYPLTQMLSGRGDLRPRCLLTGLVQCLILSRKVPGWEKEYYHSGQLLTDFFFGKLPARAGTIPEHAALEEQAAAALRVGQEARQARFDSFAGQNGWRVEICFKSIPGMRGCDPMHAESVGEQQVLHPTMLMLGRDANEFTFTNGAVCTATAGAIWFVQSLYFFLPDRSQLTCADDMVVLNIPGKQIRWKGRVVSESARRLQLELE